MATEITERERMIFRNMSAADKLGLAAQMHIQARQWKSAALKAQHPDWSPEKIDRKVYEVFLYGSG